MCHPFFESNLRDLEAVCLALSEKLERILTGQPALDRGRVTVCGR
jgi:hypothetical protein